MASIGSLPGISITPLPPEVPTTGDYKKYAKELRKMSNPELKAEIQKQQERLWMATHGIRYDAAMAKDATIKLQLCRAEVGRRANDVGPYQAKLERMTVAQLRDERTRIQTLLETGRFTQDGRERMEHRLELVNREIQSRRVQWFDADVMAR